MTTVEQVIALLEYHHQSKYVTDENTKDTICDVKNYAACDHVSKCEGCIFHEEELTDKAIKDLKRLLPQEKLIKLITSE